MTVIWIDADACPLVIKEIIFRASKRLQVAIKMVANQFISHPKSALIEMVIVPKTFDAADAYIVLHVVAKDLVITADIPLAASVVEKGAIAINPRGEVYTHENAKVQLSVRNFMHDMRGAGLVTSYTPALNKIDMQKFAAAFDKHLTKKLAE